MLILKKGDRGKAVSGWQRDLQAAGFYIGFRVDDYFWTETDKATRAFQRAAGILDDGEVGGKSRGAMEKLSTPKNEKPDGDSGSPTLAPDAARGTLGSEIARIAQGQLDVRETSRNQGPGIAKFWTATNYGAGYRNREPYCAAFVCWCAMMAGLPESARPSDAAVRFLVAWALRPGNGTRVFSSGLAGFAPQAGDLVYFAFSGAFAPNHIGIVEDYDGTTVFTIEANTDGTGGREGDGVYRRRRAKSLCKGFIRLGVAQ